MRLILIYLFCLTAGTNLFAQLSLKGKVINADGGKPIASANVFLANTSIGTVSNEKGEFVIEQFPAGRYDLVVSFIGYESYVIALQSGRLPADLEIKLKVKVDELKEVIVEPYEKHGWIKWGKFFMENFIGTSVFAEDCELVNKDVIKFRFNRKKNILQAFADDRLVIENKALGYLLKYDLISFDFDFNTRRFLYQGYPLFEEMKAKRDGIQKKWINNRQEAYYGSMMHFMRSVFRNKLVEQQFEVRKIIKLPGEEQARVKAAYLKARIPVAMSGHQVVVNDSKTDLHPDTLDYYRKVMQNPDGFNILINRILPGDSIAYAIDSVSVGLDFSDYLQIVYPPKKTPLEYGKSMLKVINRDTPITSEIFRVGKDPVVILANGTYFDGTNLISTQYWAWSEKIASLLPVDYWPPPKKK